MQILQGLQARNSQKFSNDNSRLTDIPERARKKRPAHRAFSRFRDCFRYPKIHQQSAGGSVFNMPATAQ
jgi:hypothetical protein